MADPAWRAVRGRVLTFLAPPLGAGDGASYRYLADGLVLARDGRIAAVGEAGPLLATLPADTPVDHYPDGLVLPGFIDPHIHFPQTQVIASYGAQLLEWLEKYTFVEEQRFADAAHAAEQAVFFFDELARNGTTTALAFCSVHPVSADAFFTEAERRGMGMLGGKVMMDRNAPPALTDTAQSGYDETKALIERWHGRGRQRVAITPRFAVTSTPEQLAAAGTLKREHPDLLVQTHLSENHAEIETVRRLFPEATGYLDVYDRFGLTGERSLFGHCIHLTEAERRRMAETGSVAVFCPTSNLFIGSGLFGMGQAREAPAMRVAVATDVGGGTSFSMLRTLAEGYKVQQLLGRNWSALEAFHLATAGNAAALGLAGEIGTLEPGAFADLVVLDARATPVMANRMARIDGDLEEELFVLMTLGDDRAVRATYAAGRLIHAAS